VEATRQITGPGRDGPAKVLVLTTFDLDEYVVEALRAGASGFLLKDARPEELTSAVRSVAAGDAAVSGRVTRAMLELFADRLPANGSPSRGGADPVGALTPREREILLAIGEGLSNGEIGARFYLTESTVKTHVGRVLSKLQLRDRVHAVIFAYENGLLER
jgi:DNA-binding NarL/FixJ family response regulator